jgi:hypothetical protein
MREKSGSTGGNMKNTNDTSNISAKNAAFATLNYFNSIVPGLADATYRAVEAASVSFLKLFSNTPAHAKAAQEKKHEQSPAQRLGTLAHMAILEPVRFATEVIVLPADAPRRPTDRQLFAKNPSPESREAIEYWHDFDEAAGEKQLISVDELMHIRNAKEAVLAHPEARKVLTGGQSEVSMFWIDEDSGARCKARMDRWNQKQGVIVDLKKIDVASDFRIKQSISQYKYHYQEAHYRNGGRAVTGARDVPFIFIFFEVEPPYGVRVGPLDPLVSEAAHFAIKPLVKAYHDAVTKNDWPSYHAILENFTLPDYEMRQLQYGGKR